MCMEGAEISHIIGSAHPHPSGTCLRNDGPTRTHGYGPKSAVYVRVRAWWRTFCGLEKGIMTCIRRYHVIRSSFAALKPLCVRLLIPPLQHLAPADPFAVSPVSECHTVGIPQYAAFPDWLLSLSNMHLRFLHVFPWLDSLFLFSNE